jgi:hypothetical protein
MDLRPELEEVSHPGLFQQVGQIVSGDQYESLIQTGDRVLKPDQRCQRLGGKFADVCEVESQQFTGLALSDRPQDDAPATGQSEPRRRITELSGPGGPSTSFG